MSLDRTDTSSLDASSLNPAGARLLVEESGRPPRVVTLRPGTTVRVGRSDEIEVPLDDVRASRVHASFSYDGRTVTVRDLESSNGTFLGEQRLSSVTSVQPGDVVRVGSTRLIVVQPETGARPAAIEPNAPGLHGAAPGGAAGDRARTGPRSLPPTHDVIAVDPATVALFALVRRLAGSDLPVLVQGETGSGKEVVARALHRLSPRAGRPFIAVNCATLPETIAESELFGHEKGSFTGAFTRKVGVFEAANGGTLFLDEAGELSGANQARLLRALQERVIVRVGATQPVQVDVRVVAATNRDLASDVARGRFREDLYFRLNGVTVAVPALRARPRDVLPLAERILHEVARGRPLAMSAAFSALLQSYRWPGNVRELRNAIECAVALADDDELRPEHLPPALRARASTPAADKPAAEKTQVERPSIEAPAGDKPAGEPRDEVEGLAISAQATLRTRVDDVEKLAIVAALDAAGWNQSRTARELGISRRALIYKMERYGLKARPGRDEPE